MTCRPADLARFLAGDLPADTSARVDAHLLSCDACWRAVADARCGRDAAVALREPAPAGLEDRIRLAIDLADTAGATRPRLRRVGRYRLAIPAAVAAAALVVLGVAHVETAPRSTLEGAVARAAGPSAVTQISTYAIDGTAVAVARPGRGTPMPTGAGAQPPSTALAWVVRRDGVTIVCTRRTGAILAGRASADQLLAVAARLHLA